MADTWQASAYLPATRRALRDMARLRHAPMLSHMARQRAATQESAVSQIHFLRARPAAAERLICLHGSGASPRQRQPYRPALGLRFEMLAPELISYAGTGRWPAGTPASLDDEARRLAPLLQRGRVHLPDATHTVFDGLGHMGPVEDAARIGTTLDRRGPLAALRLAA